MLRQGKFPRPAKCVFQADGVKGVKDPSPPLRGRGEGEGAGLGRGVLS
jgi:hypothetical protein